MKTRIQMKIQTMMKNSIKLTTLAMVMLIANMGWSQTFLVQNALSVIKNNDLDLLEETAEDLNKALLDPSTADNAKMWYARARIFGLIANSADTNVNAIDNNAAEKSLDAYINFFGKEGNKQSYVNASLENFPYTYQKVYSAFVTLANAGKINEANAMIEKMKLLYDFEDPKEVILTNFSISKNKLDLLAYENCAIGGKAYNAQGKMYLQRLIDNGYTDVKLYGYMANYAMQDGDTVKAIDYINEGREIDPTDMGLIREEINIYISMGKNDILLGKVDEGIKNEPTNSQLHFIRGFLNQEFGNLEDAEKDYEKAVEFDPMNFDAMLNLGGLYVDRAENLKRKKYDIDPDDYTAQDALAAKVKAVYEKALPLLEDVVNNKEISSNQEKYQLLKSIKSIYVNLKDKEKIVEYQARIAEITE